ncbi:hypothetical protein ACFL09_05840 [Planctomycetota bacterium]
MEWTPDPDHPLTKVCTKCGEEKHLMEFYLRYDTGRRRRDCKACCRARGRRYSAAHAERYRARARAWYAANGERCRARDRERYAANRARQRERAREWARHNAPRVREIRRRSEQRDPRRLLVRQVSRGLVKLGMLDVADRCADCGGGPIELHHPDYGDPFHVVPLCKPCHSRRHWAHWRRYGGGPVKYPEEYEDGQSEQARSGAEEQCRMSNSE